MPDGQPNVLILTPVKDAASHLPRFLACVRRMEWPREHLAIGFLESDSRDGSYQQLTASRAHLENRFRSVALWKRDFGFHPATQRWHPSIQRPRRSILARSRNELLARSLGDDDDWVLWIDADMASWPADLIQNLLAPGKAVVVPHVVVEGTHETFDLNTWRLKPDYRGFDFSPWLVDGLIQPPAGLGRQYLGELQHEPLVELDAVGGCVLLVQANLHRAGLVFPDEPVEGLIETEGLAVLARQSGHHCWGLPRLIVSHSR